ncbi:hypothetical protein VN12_26195 [Pirellula sp. SH-Sr6A]|nr:hypothetical protein VN12_26195 [Pirellula sp. SH-Sr6A]
MRCVTDSCKSLQNAKPAVHGNVSQVMIIYSGPTPRFSASSAVDSPTIANRSGKTDIFKPHFRGSGPVAFLVRDGRVSFC